jgi:hypothetical protein
MRRVLTKKIVNQNTRYSTDLNLLYFNNNKVGCTTIKYSIWAAIDRLNEQQTFRGRIHPRDGDPFVSDIFAMKSFDAKAFAEASKFSVVRNPFVRILSGYLQKVGKDFRVWGPFCKRFGIRQEITQNELTFEDFLNIVAAEPDELLNGHFRPQYMNLLVPFTRLTFVGQLEDPAGFTLFLSSFGVSVEEVRRNPTSATELLSGYYNRNCIEIVREKYADDFRLFGYSTEIREVRDVEPIVPPNPETDLLVAWVLTGEPPVFAFDPAARAFHEFGAATSIDQKAACVRHSICTEDNWSRLQAYSRFANELGDQPLSDEIEDRITSLRNSHRARVKNPGIFVPL